MRPAEGHSLILSFRPTIGIAEREAVSRRAVESLAGLGNPEVLRIALNEETVVYTTCARSRSCHNSGKLVILHGVAAITSSGDALRVDRLAGQLENGTEACDTFEPPFLIITGDASGGSAISDPIGLVHLFTSDNRGCAAVATSAALLARTFALPFAFQGMYQQMTIGHRLEDATAFSGITLVPPGVRATISRGRVDFLGRASVAVAGVAQPLDAGRDAIVTAVSRCLSAIPNCAIELSGGLDSRMVLAAIPRELRKGRNAYTIGYPGSPDLNIAVDIAERFSMEHEFIDLSSFADEDLECTWNRARRVAYRDDFCTNLVDRLAIDCVDDTLLTCPRLGGVNGELARGFYYPMLPVHSIASERNADSLIRWRLTVNDAAPRELFKRHEREAADADLRVAVINALGLQRSPLGSALDWFYLRQRMRHWAGAGISRANMSRVLLTPFFHGEYIDWAMAAPIDFKKGSAGFSAILAELDPDLASMPLDSGIRPLDIAKGGLSAGLAVLRQKAKKVSLKVGQRLGVSRAHTIGSKQFAVKLGTPELLERINWNAFSKTKLFADEGLDRLRAGAIPRSRESLGYIVPLHFVIEYLDAPSVAYRVTDLRVPGAD